MDIVDGFFYGLFGGLLAELLGLFKLRHEISLPSWLKSPFYWLVTCAMICAGGGVVIIYLKSGMTLNPLLAVNVGASAPLILGTLVSQAPPVDPGKVD